MATLNRFPLWGLFASRAALRIGYSESEARLLGYSTALLYAILRMHRGGKKKIGANGASGTTVKSATSNITTATEIINFAGMDFQCSRVNGRIVQTVVGGEVQTADKFRGQIEGKIRTFSQEGGTMLSALCEAFDRFLANYSPEELQGSSLYTLYATWRDACKSGFNLVDLDALLGWLKEHTHAACAA
jgi:hypothetical protein